MIGGSRSGNNNTNKMECERLCVKKERLVIGARGKYLDTYSQETSRQDKGSIPEHTSSNDCEMRRNCQDNRVPPYSHLSCIVRDHESTLGGSCVEKEADVGRYNGCRWFGVELNNRESSLLMAVCFRPRSIKVLIASLGICSLRFWLEYL